MSKNRNRSMTEEKDNKNYYINIKEDFLNNKKLNFSNLNNIFNSNNSINSYIKNIKNQNDSNAGQDSFIIKERYLYKNNINANNNINLNISLLFSEDTDNQIKNWIKKEKKVSEFQKNKEKNQNILFFDSIINNKEFDNYQISNKYFNNKIFLNKKVNNRKPIKSMNFGDYFDLELSKFKNKLNNFNYYSINQNNDNSRHIFKPIY